MVCALEAVARGRGVGHRAAAGVLLTAICALQHAPAAANDPTAELAAGGLVLTTNTGIEMRWKELYISPRQVRVSYRFYNGSPRDIRTVVAFPMPDITVADVAANLPLPTGDPQNLLGFSTQVDGAPAKARAVQKVFARGADRTADLDRIEGAARPALAHHRQSPEPAAAR